MADDGSCQDCGATDFKRRTRHDCGLLVCWWCHRTHKEMNEFGLACREPTRAAQL